MSDQSANLLLPDGLNIAAGNFRLVPGARNEIAHAPFLDGRFSKGREAKITSFANADKLILARKLEPPVYIFHTAFCCSTLLSRALDRKGAIFSLKEPNLLMGLANAKRVGPWAKDQAAFRAGLSRSINLLSALAPPGETPLIKPTNAANNLLPFVLETDPKAKVLVIHSDLKNFLISVLKKGEEGRKFTRFIFNIMMFDAAFTRDMPPRDQMRLTDLQIAAMVWHLQTDPIKAGFAKFGEDRISSLHVDAFLADQATMLAKTAEFLNLDFPQASIEEVLAGPILRQDPKQEAVSYSAAQRTEEMEQTKEQFSEDIEATLAWAAKLPIGGFDDGNFPNKLPG